MSRCSLSWSASDALAAFDEGDLAHVKSCEACSEVVSIRARAKAAWSSAIEEDDAHARLSSELRLAHAWPKPRVVPARSIAAGVALAAAAAFALVASVRDGALAATLVTPAPLSPRLARALPKDEPARDQARTIVVTAPCAACRIGASKVTPGASVAAGERIEVPSGARLMLGFAFEDGLVDPKQGTELEGPAVASVASVANRELALDRGTAHVRDADVVVVTPTTRVVTKNAIYTVRVDENGAARVEVESGTVSVDVPGATAPVTVAPGKPLEIAPSARPTSAAVAPTSVTSAGKAEEPAKPSPDDALRDARALFRSGDVDGARPKLEELAASPDARIARRAQFTLAEMELASGKKDDARARLDVLLAAPDASLAADAAMLLARSHTSPLARANAWDRYLATLPSSPYRERAMLERAEALLDAHRTAEATALLEQVKKAPDLPLAQKRQLDRLTFKAREVH